MDIRKLCPRQPHQAVLDTDDLLSHYIILKFRQQIIDLADNARRGIFNRQHRKISAALIDGNHRIPERFHMEAADLLPEITHHRRLGIGAVRSLKDHPRLPRIEFIHADKRKPAESSFFRQHLILELSADGHNLFKQFRNTMSVKIIAGKRPEMGQFFHLPLLVKHLLARLDLIFRHLCRNPHSPLIQRDDLSVDLVDPLPKLTQIFHFFLHFGAVLSLSQ